MTEVEDRPGLYIHYICGLLCDSFAIVDFDRMRFAMTDDLLEVGVTDDEPKCEVCAVKEGYKLRCLKKMCKKVIHPFCMQEFRKSKLNKYHEEIEGTEDHDMT